MKLVAISTVRPGQRVMHRGYSTVVAARLYFPNLVVLRFKHKHGVTEIRKRPESLVELVSSARARCWRE